LEDDPNRQKHADAGSQHWQTGPPVAISARSAVIAAKMERVMEITTRGLKNFAQ